MFSFSGCTKKSKNVKFELWDTLLGMHTTICNCHPRPQGSTPHSCAQKVMGSAFWTICFVPQHSMHRVKPAKLSFALQLRLQSHFGPGKIVSVNYQNISMFWETLQREKKNLSYPEVYWGIGDIAHTYTVVHMMLVVRAYSAPSGTLYFIVYHRKRCPTDIRVRVLENQLEVICHGRLWKSGCTNFPFCIHTPSQTDFSASPITKCGSPPLSSVLPLPFVSAQQNTAETVLWPCPI